MGLRLAARSGPEPRLDGVVLGLATAPESSSFLGSGICTAGLGLAVGPATCWMYLSRAARASVGLAICRSFMLLPRAIW